MHHRNSHCRSLINISIPGYKFFHRNSATVIGGVGIYINDSLKFEILDDFNLDIAGVEEIWIEFNGSGFPKDTKRVLGCIYRHPSRKTEIFLIKSFIYTRCSTPKRVTSLRGPSPRHCARATQLLSKKCCSGGEPLATLCPI